MIWFDTDKEYDKVSGRSITEILIYMGKSPVNWSSNRREVVDTGTHGSKFIVVKSATEEALNNIYMLRSWEIQV